MFSNIKVNERIGNRRTTLRLKKEGNFIGTLQQRPRVKTRGHLYEYNGSALRADIV